MDDGLYAITGGIERRTLRVLCSEKARLLDHGRKRWAAEHSTRLAAERM